MSLLKPTAMDRIDCDRTALVEHRGWLFVFLRSSRACSPSRPKAGRRPPPAPQQPAATPPRRPPSGSEVRADRQAIDSQAIDSQAIHRQAIDSTGGGSGGGGGGIQKQQPEATHAPNSNNKNQELLGCASSIGCERDPLGGGPAAGRSTAVQPPAPTVGDPASRHATSCNEEMADPQLDRRDRSGSADGAAGGRRRRACPRSAGPPPSLASRTLRTAHRSSNRTCNGGPMGEHRTEVQWARRGSVDLGLAFHHRVPSPIIVSHHRSHPARTPSCTAIWPFRE